MKKLILLGVFLSLSSFANQPPPPRTLSLMKLEAVLKEVRTVLTLDEKLIATRELPSHQYLIEKRNEEGNCSTMLFELKYIPHEIPGFFHIEAELSPKPNPHLCASEKL